MFNGLMNYWDDLHFRIKELVKNQQSLEALVVRKGRVGVNVKGRKRLSYRTQNGRLVPHSYTQYVLNEESNEIDEKSEVSILP